MPSTGKPVICTIIAKNYVSFARTLCKSFLRYHPDGTCFTLIIDDIENLIEPRKEPFEIVPIDRLGIPNIRDFCFKYNITELSTAAKPFFLRYLLEEKAVSSLLYLDPDILITHSLLDIYGWFESGDILLTPHLDKDYPEDNFLPDDVHILKSGIFNLGFIGVRRCDNTDRFLAWWQSKTYDKCRIDHANGYFVDQKFIDLIVTLFPNIEILRDPGYNVAYWNLHSRSVSLSGNEWRCNGNVLFFYHFSDFKPERPNCISRHQTRQHLENLPDLKKLFSMYTEMLNSNGYSDTANWPYTHNYFSNGIFINFLIRKIYRARKTALYTNDPFQFDRHPALYKILFRILAFSYNIYRKAK